MGVATEDDGNTDVEDFLDVVFRQLWEGRFRRMRMAMKMTETSRDNKHEEDFMTRLMFETLCECEGKPSLLTSWWMTSRLPFRPLRTFRGMVLDRSARTRVVAVHSFATSWWMTSRLLFRPLFVAWF